MIAALWVVALSQPVHDIVRTGFLVQNRRRVNRAPSIRGDGETPRVTVVEAEGAVLKEVRPSISAGFADELLNSSFVNLSELCGGTTRARMIWDCVRDGVQPLGLQGDGESHGDGTVLPSFVSRETRQKLGLHFGGMDFSLTQRGEKVSGCGTRKLLTEFRDGLQVETVLIPSDDKTTVCVSSQVGCSRGCIFCSTGRMGLLRNLSSGEILCQIFQAQKRRRETGMPRLERVVFMGMGEPMNNPKNVREAIEALVDEKRFKFSKRKVTLSTVGVSPASIRQLVDFPCVLAWSLHAASDEKRQLLVPTTRHGVSELSGAFLEVMEARKHLKGSLRLLMVEVALMAGLNDGEEDARLLASVLSPVKDRVLVNLIPYNDTGAEGLRRSSEESVRRFQRALWAEGLRASVRVTRGDEESAACGQLATSAKANDAVKDPQRVTLSTFSAKA